MIKYQIQTLFYPDEWECAEECPVLYDTQEQAEIELEDNLNDLAYAVEMGYMEDMDADAWRVAAVEVQE